MELHKAQLLAQKLMGEHGLNAQGWTFVFHSKRRSLGTCNYAKKQVQLSSHNTLIDSEEDVKDTILHEIAHALVGPHVQGHGWQWKAMCRKIGAKPNRLAEKRDVQPQGKYTLKCPKCGDSQQVYRKTKKEFACVHCCKKHNFGRWSPEYRLELIQNY